MMQMIADRAVVIFYNSILELKRMILIVTIPRLALRHSETYLGRVIYFLFTIKRNNWFTNL